MEYTIKRLHEVQENVDPDYTVASLAALISGHTIGAWILRMNVGLVTNQIINSHQKKRQLWLKLKQRSFENGLYDFFQEG